MPKEQKQKPQQTDEVKILIKSKTEEKRSNFYQYNFLTLKLVAKNWMDF